MGSKRSLILVVLVMFIAGFVFSLSQPGRAVAENMKPLLVTIENIPLPVSGSVSVDNLPLDTATSSLVTKPAAGLLRDGHAFMSIQWEPSYPRRLDVPVGVVLTDVVLHYSNPSDETTCSVWVSTLENNGFGSMFTLTVSQDKPLAELHLTSGLRSTDARKIGLFLNSACLVEAMWTGYQE